MRRQPLARLHTTAVGLVMASGLVISGTANAAAAPAPAVEQAAPVVKGVDVPATPADLVVTEEQVAQALNELRATDVPRTVSLEDGRTATTFHFEEGFSMTFVEPGAVKGQAGLDLGGGRDGWGIYVSFNRLDQQAILAGTGALLVAGICAIPGVGWVACGVAAALVAVAAVYLSDRGICTNNRQLRVYVTSRRARCV